MRFKFCCDCGDPEDKTSKNSGVLSENVISVVTQQPKPAEGNQLDRVPQVPGSQITRDEANKSSVFSLSPKPLPAPRKPPPASPDGLELTFIQIGPDHFKSSYRGKEFSVLKGRIQTDDGVDDDLDKELILRSYYMTMLGLQLGQKNRQADQPEEKSDVAKSEKRLKTVNEVADNQGHKRRKQQEELQTDRPASPKECPKPTLPSVDECDGTRSTYIPEPTLPKTTLSPKELIYDDPKTYEALDKNELPAAKRLDEFIISKDEFVKSGNLYYFHESRPKRVFRKKLTPKQSFDIMGPDRYVLFENASLEAHNEFRKLHGLQPLVHSEFLSQVAKEWAEHLALTNTFDHRPRNEYGENLYRSDITSCARTAVKAWYDEIDLYDYDNPGFSTETGHFTQMIWKDVREVGTGIAQVGTKIWVCCNYHPPGNHLDKFNDEYVPRPLAERVKEAI